jgi:hypothetical protein
MCERTHLVSLRHAGRRATARRKSSHKHRAGRSSQHVVVSLFCIKQAPRPPRGTAPSCAQYGAARRAVLSTARHGELRSARRGMERCAQHGAARRAALTHSLARRPARKRGSGRTRTPGPDSAGNGSRATTLRYRRSGSTCRTASRPSARPRTRHRRECRRTTPCSCCSPVARGCCRTSCAGCRSSSRSAAAVSPGSTADCSRSRRPHLG